MKEVCVLCREDGGEILFKNNLIRGVYITDPYYPGFVRLILNQHIKELSDLDEKTASYVLNIVYKIEKIIRSIYRPDKINLASLGNVVPHLHWHMIPRYTSDRHFPNPIWGEITHPHYQAPYRLLEHKALLIEWLQAEFKDKT